MEQCGNRNLVAAVDCTGHGVPGAFMSIVGYNLLNQAVNEHGIDQPAVILNEINRGLSKQLRQQNETISVRDGMDIALCAIDSKEKKLLYAGANNPLWIIRKGELIQVKADKQPIGIYNEDEMKQFTLHEMDLHSEDMIYIFSDGYADQFGGHAGKKFKYKGFQQLLLSISLMSLNKQRDVLERTIEEWRGELEQVDDILVIGIKVD
jgi:serine phosphatase RsbU (regulator of sigma subunit)